MRLAGSHINDQKLVGFAFLEICLHWGLNREYEGMSGLNMKTNQS